MAEPDVQPSANGGAPRRREAVVIGAGPAGLASAAMLKRAGVDVVVVDKADAVGASWRRHYDRLHLHTVRWLSHLPGYRFSRRHGRWVPRDGVVRYLEGYVRHHGLEVELGVEVQRLDRVDTGGWRLRVAGGGDIEADHVVVATGYNHTPFLQDWPGRDGFKGELLHASRYRNPEPYRGRDVLVVGSGNTGAEIAIDLVEGGAARVRLAVRTPPNIVLREANGMPGQILGLSMRHVPPPVVDRVIGTIQKVTIPDLTEHGLPRPERGVYTRIVEDDVIPIIDVGLIEMVRAGRVEIVAGLEGFDGASVLLADGSRIEPDAVIVATGYRRGLEELVGHLDVLAPNGRPKAHGPDTAPHAPNLHFIGYTNPISGMFRELNIDARRIAYAIARDRAARDGATSPTDRLRTLVAIRLGIPAAGLERRRRDQAGAGSSGALRRGRGQAVQVAARRRATSVIVPP
jgi:putative flavoprotein involved in K+ transport